MSIQMAPCVNVGRVGTSFQANPLQGQMGKQDLVRMVVEEAVLLKSVSAIC